MEITTIGKAGPDANSLKKPVKLKEKPILIKYKNKVYEIKWNELRNIGLDHRTGVDTRAAKYGMGDTGFFGKTCHYCGYNKSNIFSQFFGGKGDPDVIIVNDTGALETTCEYNNDSVKIHSTFRNKKIKKTINAICDPCAFEHALVSFLADNGYLKNYETDKPFNYLPLSDFETGKANPDEHLVKKEGLVSKVLSIFK